MSDVYGTDHYKSLILVTRQCVNIYTNHAASVMNLINDNIDINKKNLYKYIVERYLIATASEISILFCIPNLRKPVRDFSRVWLIVSPEIQFIFRL